MQANSDGLIAVANAYQVWRCSWAEPPPPAGSRPTLPPSADDLDALRPPVALEHHVDAVRQKLLHVHVERRRKHAERLHHVGRVTPGLWPR